MPVRNEERFIKSALASIKAQSMSAWQLIAVDDNSTDSTPQILAAAALADPRIRVLHNENPGLVNALNLGLANCIAPLVARMDGDDVCHPLRLEKQLEIFGSNQEIGLVASSFRHFPRKGLKVGMLAYETWQNSLVSHDLVMRDIFVESPFAHPGVMFVKSDLERLGGYRAMGWAEDYDLWLRLAQNGVRFARTVDPLIYWRDRPERATRTMDEYSEDAFRRCKLHHLRSGFLKGSTGVILAGAGKEGRCWSRLLDEAGIRLDGWVDVDPKKSGTKLHGAVIKAPDELKPTGIKMLVTVGTRGARAGIRNWAANAGFTELEDFVCVT